MRHGAASCTCAICAAPRRSGRTASAGSRPTTVTAAGHRPLQPAPPATTVAAPHCAGKGVTGCRRGTATPVVHWLRARARPELCQARATREVRLAPAPQGPVTSYHLLRARGGGRAPRSCAWRPGRGRPRCLRLAGARRPRAIVARRRGRPGALQASLPTHAASGRTKHKPPNHIRPTVPASTGAWTAGLESAPRPALGPAAGHRAWCYWTASVGQEDACVGR